MRAATTIIACSVIAVVATGCAQTEVARFQARAGQEALVRDGRPAIVSRRASSLVIVSPASRQFRSGNRPVYVVAINNLTNKPINFSMSGLWVGQMVGGQASKQLRVYRYEDLVREEQNRQIAAAVVTGLAAGANAYSAASAGHYNANATVSGPRGTSNVSIRGYDPTAAQIAQTRAAAENEAMIASTIETGRQNLAILEKAVIKDNTMMPGEWYGGQLQFDPPRDEGGKNIIINIQVGADVHQVEVTHDPT
jgi:hypothetical protein